MNRESINLGQRTTTVQRTVTVATSSTVLLTAAPNRVSLIINAPSTNRLTLSMSDTAVLDTGITLYAGNPPLILTLEEHGILVTRAWSAISATAGQDVTLLETYLVG